MALKLTGTPKSSCTLKVLLTLAEKGVSNYQFIDMDLMKGEQKASKTSLPSHLSKQPFGVVPILEDGDICLYESRAICRYIARKYQNVGTNLIPNMSDLKTMSQFEQWACVEMANFDVVARPLQWEVIFKPLAGEAKNEQLIHSLVNTLAQKLDVYDRAVPANQQYMAGNTFSIVDIFYMPLMSYLFRMGYGDMIMDRPNVKTWWESVSSRDSWKRFGVSATV
ncbi:putative glutathion S-transferase II, GST-II [Trichoderma evansii]